MLTVMRRVVRRGLSTSAYVGSETRALQALFSAQGHTPCEPTSCSGLHPLVVPLAHTSCGDALGLVRWPLNSESVTVVRTRPQVASADATIEESSLSLIPCGTPAQYARRAAAEADADEGSGDASGILTAAAAATLEAGGIAYASGELAASRLGASHFLLLRVGPFTDVWASVAQGQLAKGDETAALIAAERASSLNPGWGCAVYLQARLMGSLGRTEEQRDLALSALESPFWTLGSPLEEALAAAQLSHVDDLRGLVRAMEDKVREQQNAPARTPKELALMAALDTLDEVVRTKGRWDEARPAVAKALRQAGLDDVASVADTA